MQNLELQYILFRSWHKIAWQPASLFKINGGSILTHLNTVSGIVVISSEDLERSLGTFSHLGNQKLNPKSPCNLTAVNEKQLRLFFLRLYKKHRPSCFSGKN